MKASHSMRMRSLFALILALPLGACAGLMGGDPELYRSLSDGDVRLASRLMQTTLEQAPDGATRKWVNDETGHSGSITPTRTYVSASGYYCREYREELAIGAETGRFYHTACRDDDAHWTWL